ncbi:MULTISPECIES: hypothetical protein [Prochlorococcus]|uniref:hypothetical protein n=1 Tax=Prochlorococcus TaxID=1218 RepID=UPI000533ADC8|nr:MULTISPECIES: hypothetical protein [Prochlorococcus]KGG13290.1 hypothetical protein EV05_0969 [Prochlorococcus sp. MIT 0601]
MHGYSSRIDNKQESHINHSGSSEMIRLEQITAIFLAAALAIPSYWFFWTLAGGGGYDRREATEAPLIQKLEPKPSTKN